MIDSSFFFSLFLQIIERLRPDGISFHLESVKSTRDGLTYSTRDQSIPSG